MKITLLLITIIGYALCSFNCTDFAHRFRSDSFPVLMQDFIGTHSRGMLAIKCAMKTLRDDIQKQNFAVYRRTFLN